MVALSIKSTLIEILVKCSVSTEKILNPEGYIPTLTQHYNTGHLHIEMLPTCTWWFILYGLLVPFIWRFWLNIDTYKDKILQLMRRDIDWLACYSVVQISNRKHLWGGGVGAPRVLNNGQAFRTPRKNSLLIPFSKSYCFCSYLIVCLLNSSICTLFLHICSLEMLATE